jgi:cobalt/nickel transport system permease protein
MFLHVTSFRLALDSHQKTPWHSLTPQTRLLCTILGVFAIALTPNGRWWTWAIYGVGVLSLIRLSRLSLPILLKRVGIEFVLVGVVLLGTLFREGGTVLWSWGIFQINTAGLNVLGSVTLKVLLSLLMLNLLILTTSIPDLLQALLSLRIPPLLVAIMASMYRYLAVLVVEFQTMRRAAVSRNLMLNSPSYRLVLGNMIGALFIRTYERGERVYQAMLARGYRGVLPTETIPSLRKRDFLALTLTGILLLLGQIV